MPAAPPPRGTAINVRIFANGFFPKEGGAQREESDREGEEAGRGARAGGKTTFFLLGFFAQKNRGRILRPRVRLCVTLRRTRYATHSRHTVDATPSHHTRGCAAMSAMSASMNAAPTASRPTPALRRAGARRAAHGRVVRRGVVAEAIKEPATKFVTTKSDLVRARCRLFSPGSRATAGSDA